MDDTIKKAKPKTMHAINDIGKGMENSFFSHTQMTVGTVIVLLCLKFLAILSEFFASCMKSVEKKK